MNCSGIVFKKNLVQANMIEAIILKLCFDENQLQQYLEDHNKIATVIHASYNEEQEEIDCYFVRIEKW